MKILLKSILVMMFLMSFHIQAAEPVEAPETPVETEEEQEPDCD